MIKAKYQEGNIVNHYYDGDEHEQVTVVGQVYDRVHIQLPTGGGTDVDIKTIEPIPLTPEWLERCGFKEEKKGFYVNYNRKDTEGCCLDFLTLRRHEVSAFYELGREHEDYFELYTQNKHRILHLHQLQNLYFALTGEELTIK